LTVLNGDVAAMATADAATANTMHVIRRKRIAAQKDISISDTKKTTHKLRPGLSNKRFRLWLAARSQSNLIRWAVGFCGCPCSNLASIDLKRIAVATARRDGNRLRVSSRFQNGGWDQGLGQFSENICIFDL
jgi:hypothetical protein